MQILHLNEYLANKTASSVQAPALAENTWTLLQTDRSQDHNTYGEAFIQLMLANHINKTEAERTAAGWNGDNFTYYERGSDYLFTWNIGWDTNCDASEFYIAFHSMANAAGATDTGSCNWQVNGRYLSISWNQNQNTTLVACSNVEAATQPSYFH
jgi:hypothetical protein